MSGTLLDTFGSFISGQEKASAYANNARLEQQQGRIAIQQSYAKAGLQADQTQRAIGAQRAAFGASGVVASSGTPLQVMADTAAKGEMARQMTLYQGRVTALSNQEQADADLAAKHSANVAAWMGAATTFESDAEKAMVAAAAAGG